MAVPKKRTGHSSQGKRRANWKATKPETTICSNCGEPALTHTVCTACGFYKGEPVSLKDKAAKEEVKQYLKDIRTNKSKFIAASFAELFTSPAKRVQIFFADFWGLGKTYNRPGTTTGNWALRLEETFEDDYYKAVPQGKAPNFADAVSTALKQRGLDKGNEQLIKDLDASAKILNEA